MENGTASDFDRDAAIQQIGRIVLEDRKTNSVEWDGISLVARMAGTEEGMHGYRYVRDDWEGFTPRGGFDVIDVLQALRDDMERDKGARWHQALIWIWRPDPGAAPEMNVQFEYDDPQRWSVGRASLDLGDYARSIRPPIG